MVYQLIKSFKNHISRQRKNKILTFVFSANICLVYHFSFYNRHQKIREGRSFLSLSKFLTLLQKFLTLLQKFLPQFDVLSTGNQIFIHYQTWVHEIGASAFEFNIGALQKENQMEALFLWGTIMRNDFKKNMAFFAVSHVFRDERKCDI